MKWHKQEMDDNHGKPMPVWVSECGRFIVSLNYNNGLSKGKEVDKAGHCWWYEVTQKHPDKRVDFIKVGEESYIGKAPSLKTAKQLADIEAEDISKALNTV